MITQPHHELHPPRTIFAFHLHHSSMPPGSLRDVRGTARRNGQQQVVIQLFTLSVWQHTRRAAGGLVAKELHRCCLVQAPQALGGPCPAGEGHGAARVNGRERGPMSGWAGMRGGWRCAAAALEAVAGVATHSGLQMKFQGHPVHRVEDGLALHQSHCAQDCSALPALL